MRPVSVRLCCAIALVMGASSAARAQENAVTLLITGEQIGRIRPCGCTKETVGGLTRRATVVRRLREEIGPEVLLLDNGGIVMETGRQQEIKYDITVAAMDVMEYDAAGVGFLDLGLGIDRIEANAIDASFPFIAANLLRRDGTPPLARSKVLQTPSGRLVGLMAIVGERFRTDLSRIAPGLELVDPEDVVLGLASELRPRCDLIVLLSHAPVEETRSLVRTVPGIDVAVTGHLIEKPFPEPETVGRTLVIGTGLYGKWLARLTVKLDREGRPIRNEEGVIRHDYAPVFLGGDVKEDEEVAEILEDYRLAVIDERIIEQIPREPLRDAAYLGTDSCARCHRPQFNKWITSEHARALRTLEQDGTDKDPECVVCHVVGLDYVEGFRDRQRTPTLANIGCEQCHGPGAAHAENVLAPYRRPVEKDCRACHDPENSPEFKFSVYFPKMDHRALTLHQLTAGE